MNFYRHSILFMLFLHGLYYSYSICDDDNAIETIENFNHKSKITTSSRRLSQSSECELTSKQIDEIYNKKDGIWLLNAELIENELSNDIQAIIDCATKGDIIMFDISSTIQLKSTIIVTKEDLIFTGYTEDITIKDGIFPESDTKVIFTCPKDNSIFNIESSSVILANMEIIECNLDKKDKTSPIVFNYECDEYNKNDNENGTIKLHHVTFRENNNYLNSGCFSTSEDNVICSSLEMKNVNFYNNTSEGLVIGKLMPITIMDGVNLIDNKFIENNTTDMSGVLMFIDDGYELYADNINAYDNNGTLFHLNNGNIVDISNSKFENNTCYYMNDSLPTVINSKSGSLTIKDSLFSNSSPMFIEIYDGSKLEINNCVFEYIYKGNNSIGESRALYLLDSNISVKNSNFSYNNGDGNGVGIYSENNNITLDNTFFVNNTSDGNSAIYCTCNNDYTCDADIKSSYFENNMANSGDGGGAISFYNTINVTIDDCYFIRNEASSQDGGAIFVNSQGNTSLYFKNSLFSYNRANRNGGAISFTNCDDCYLYLNIELCTFDNNDAKGRNGGSIANFSPSNTSIVSSIFSNNSATYYGSGMHIYSNELSYHYIYNSTFYKNVAFLYTGGGINIETLDGHNTKLIIENCNFTENSALGGGGALGIYFTDVTIKNTTIITSVSTDDAGGIFIESGDVKTNLTIEDSIMKNNVCMGNGGGIASNTGGSLTLIRSLIDSNMALNVGGGGVFFQSGDFDTNITVINCTFVGNNAPNGAGLIIGYKFNVSIINSSFMRNIATEYGSGIFVGDDTYGSSLYISETIFEENLVNDRGSAISVWEFLDMYIVKSTFKSNMVNNTDARGGLISTRNSIWNKYDKLTEMNSTIQYKRLKEARENAGLSVSDTDNLSIPSITVLIVDSEFSGNLAVNAYISLLDLSAGSLFDVKNCSFYDNHSKNFGNIYTDDAEFYCENCDFYNNTCENSAGVIYSYGSKKNTNDSLPLVFIKNSTFSENKGLLNTGVIYFSRGKMMIFDSNFYGNIGEFGGCMYGFDYKLELQNVIFTNNTGLTSGGALYLEGSSPDSYFNANELYFVNNHATFGGSIYFGDNNAIFNIENSIFTNNTAQSNSESYGGAICGNTKLTVAFITISNCAFLYNDAYGQGGSLYFQGYFHIKLSNTVFYANNVTYADSLGGAIALDAQGWKTENELKKIVNSTDFIGFKDYIQEKYDVMGISNSKALPSIIIELENVEFDNNTSPLYSTGALYMQNGCVASMNNCLFSNNYAQYIGGISCYNSEIYIDNCTFTSNSCVESVGALQVYHEKEIEMLNNVALAVIQNSFFSYNDGLFPGAILIFTDTSIVYSINNTFTDNIARTDCGAIAVFNGGYLYARNSNFINNKAINRAGAIGINNNDTEIAKYYFEDCLFENNSAVYGGAIYLSNGNVNVTQCDVDKNCNNNFTILISNVTFSGNRADKVGGAVILSNPFVLGIDCQNENTLYPKEFNIYNIHDDFIKSYKTSPLIDAKCDTWENNTVGESGYGDIIASNPSTILVEFESMDDSDLVIINQGINDAIQSYLILGLKSGMYLPKINLKSLDYFGNGPAYIIDQDLIATVYSSDYLFTGQIPYDLTNGSVITDEIELIGTPGNHSINIDFSVNTFNNISIIVELKSCTIGEEALNDGKICNPCNIFSFNFHPNTERCKPCPTNSRCDGKAIFPFDGYWHVSPCSTKMKRCTNYIACSYTDRDEKIYNISNTLLSCNLDNDTITLYHETLCKDGYKGPLCGSCDIGHGRVGTIECIKCSKKTTAVVFFIFSGIIFICIAAISIKGNLPSHNLQNEVLNCEISTYDPTSNPEIVETENVEDPSLNKVKKPNINYTMNAAYIYKTTMTESFKIFINYVQVTATAISINVDWSKSMKRFLSTLDFFGSVSSATTFTSMDCMIENSTENDKSIIRHLFSIAIPFFIFIIIGIFWIFKKIIKMENFNYLTRRLLLTLLVIVYISYISITKYFIRFLYCENINTNPAFEKLNEIKKLWLEDTSIECYSGNHLIVTFSLIVPLILILTIGFPIVTSSVLIYMRSKNKLETMWVTETIGFLCRAYKKDVIFWDSMIMLRKAALAVIVVFAYPLGGNQQGIMALFVLVIALSLHMSILPFKSDYDILNKCEHAGLLVSILTYTSGMLFNDDDANKYIKILLTISIITLNTLLIIGFCIIIFHRLYLFVKTTLVLKDIVAEDDYWLDVMRKIVKKSYKKFKRITLTKFKNGFKTDDVEKHGK